MGSGHHSWESVGGEAERLPSPQSFQIRPGRRKALGEWPPENPRTKYISRRSDCSVLPRNLVRQKQR